jgi:lipopolysaccharide/colanic/teichoic acid biosynthesis glycosyltransferase/glycosyltransferase involved in cell wall biosynthesis
MRILLLTQWFDPEPTLKGLRFAQEIQRCGHEVQVVTGFPNYPDGKLYDGYRMRAAKREIIGGVPVVRLALYPSHDSSAAHRVLNYISFASLATVAALLVRRPDVAYVYHPPATIGLPALVLKAVRGVPFVLDVQDLWPDTLAATGMLKNHTILHGVDRWMRCVYRAAAMVVVLSAGFREAVAGRGIPQRKIAVIHNWADESQIHVRREDPGRAKELGFAGKFNVVFAGTMGPAQALTTVLDAAELLRDEPSIRFVLVGGGIEVDLLKAETNRRNLSNVSFMARQPLHEIGEILGLADALLVHLKDDPLFEITVPSKTQAYLRAERPVLMGVRGDAAKMIQDAQAGLVFEPECPDQLAAAVLSLQGMTVEERRCLAVNGSQFYRDNLSLDIGVQRFLGVLEQTALAMPRLTAAKRAVDFLVGSAALALLSVPMAILASLIRLKLGSPVILRQARTGRNDKSFEMVKFRSMTNTRDESDGLLADRDRITPFGAKLRLSGLDCLPKLWNVVRGDMSLVGPRPLQTRVSRYLTDEMRLRSLVKPGITGLAQVNSRNMPSWSEQLALDVSYVRNRSLILDIKIVLMAFTVLHRDLRRAFSSKSTLQDLDDEWCDGKGAK